MILSIWLTGAIIMFVSAAIVDRGRVQQVRRDGGYRGSMGWMWTDDHNAVMNALFAYAILGAIWPITAPIAICALTLHWFTKPRNEA